MTLFATTRVVNKYAFKSRCKRDEIYIGRGSIWGNPFVIGRDGTREEVIEKFRVHFQSNAYLQEQLPTLRGKTLICYCKPKPCHGDIICEAVNNLEDEEEKCA